MKRFDSYQIAILLSSLSMVFGILREFVIVGLLGFTAQNDKLQAYLSIFYTIGLSIDAIRLSCLNLYHRLSLPYLILSASIISLPFCMVVGGIMSRSIGNLNTETLVIAIFGSYLNLMAALLITYKQRNNVFLAAQLINVIPNFILIPGIGFCYLFAQDMTFAIVCLTSFIPFIQCIFLLLLATNKKDSATKIKISFLASFMIFLRHFSAIIGEQIFQIITRAAFYEYGAGYLSVFAITVRLYSAVRFILIDSFIGSKLANWPQQVKQENNYLFKMINSTALFLFLAITSFFISVLSKHNLSYAFFQIIIIMIFGFYFSTLVRIIYFKINRYENNPTLIIRFAMYELMCAMIVFLLAQQAPCPILIMLWVGYIAKPFAQLLLLRKKYYGLELEIK